MKIDFDKLKAPFHANEIEWRIGQAGKNKEGKIWAKAFAYVTNRAIMQRLDDVCGPGNWRNEFVAAPNDPERKSVLCGLSIRIDGEWITKWDGADNTDVEATKGGLSDSMKRAAVQWGIGRYLYDLEEGWCDCREARTEGAHYQPANKAKEIPQFYWTPPQLPAWALPEGTGKPPQEHAREVAKQHGLTTGDKVPPPAKGKVVDFAFIKSRLEALSVSDPQILDKLDKAEKLIASEHAAGRINAAQKQQLDFQLAEIVKEVNQPQAA